MIMCIKTMKHKHADLIHAWADGAEIQYLDLGIWVDTENPHWFENDIYRIKPKDLVFEVYVEYNQWLFLPREDGIIFSNQTNNPNVRFVFDSETNKLKSVEMI